MKENLITRKRLLIAVLVIAAVAAVVAAVVLTSPKLSLKAETYTLEAGEQLPEDVTVYAEFANESYAAQASLDAAQVDTGKVGSYEASIILKDKSYPFTVEVVDTTVPEGTLKEDTMTVAQGTELKAADLVNDIIDASEVTVLFVNESDALEETYLCEETGEFEVTVKLTDAIGNEAELVQKLHVIIPDETAPVISGAKDITVYVGTTPDYLNGVTAEDETDGDVTEKIVVDSSKVDVKTAGSYKVTYTCKDEAGNEAVEEITVTVKKKQTQQTTAAGANTSSQTNTQSQQQPQQQTQTDDWWSSQPDTSSGDSGNNQATSQPDNGGSSQESSQPSGSGSSQGSSQPSDSGSSQGSSDSGSQSSSGDSNWIDGWVEPDWIDPSTFAPPMTDAEYDEMVNNWPTGK